MDDTRDIAITALEQGKSAHKRLDGINGQIKRVGDSHEAIRKEVGDATEVLRAEVKATRDEFTTALYDPEQGLVVRVADLTATVRSALKVAAALVSLIVMLAAGVGVYALTHVHHSAPPQASITK